MQNDRPTDTHTVRSRRSGLAFLAVIVMVLAVLGVWLIPRNGSDRDALLDGSTSGQHSGGGTAGVGGAIGTGGEEAPGTSNSGPGAVVPPAIIQELATITGSNDGHELIGQRVDLHAPVQRHINDVAFWVGEGDNQVLVVLARDNRDGDKRQSGVPASHGLTAMRSGQQASISGIVQRLPKAEEMFSWGLTNADRAQLMERPIYVRADRIAANGHGE